MQTSHLALMFLTLSPAVQFFSITSSRAGRSILLLELRPRRHPLRDHVQPSTVPTTPSIVYLIRRVSPFHPLSLLDATDAAARLPLSSPLGLTSMLRLITLPHTIHSWTRRWRPFTGLVVPRLR
ncbi:hypothetical protein V8G54_007081 [Vigna mungo]|uniref:Secreted protein n=1 Tax=Vigna mungo TaxID=3915 RepID=A0AAQ3S8P8_VIGMU